ncbi:hypothetical protein LCGC14_1610570 [marine sediment metagenome]|uniref:Uncharacterized protein n=1 Tax=marine sediment metagenome TaxID=412755 RepID=A0A0F9I8N1_9ZZZZ|nr:hypothetical protein [Candidatus Scalindua sp.]
MRIKESHLELYEYMKRKHDNGEQFTRSDLFEIYSKFVVRNKKLPEYRQEMTEEQILRNAISWLSVAITILIKRGYLGLTFRKNIISKKVEGGLHNV